MSFIGRNTDAQTTGRAVLQTPKRTVISGVIVDQSARVLRNAYQTPAGTTINLQTVGKHGLTVINLVNVRIDGINGYTQLAHPANGNNWSIVVVDEFTITLVGSVWVADTTYQNGVLYTNNLPIDARPEIQRLIYLAENDGGAATLTLPDGVIPLKSKSGPTHVLGLRSSLTFQGQSKEGTWLYAADQLNGHILFGFNIAKLTVQKMTVFGNRAYQATGGFHGARFNSDVGTYTGDVLFQDMNFFAIKGYGWGGQGDGGFGNCRWRNVIWNGTGSDALDIKNRSNINNNNSIENCWIYNYGLYRQGSNFIGTTLANNAITTDTGTPTVLSVLEVNNYAVGIRVTITGVQNFNGLVGPSITGTILSRGPNGYTMQIDQTATASGAGGGSGMVAYGAMYSPGDAACDTRGERWNVVNVHIESNMRGLAGVRARGGIGGPNGGGAHKSNYQSITVINTNSAAQQGTGVTLLAMDANVSGVTGTNLAAVVAVGDESRRATVTGVTGYGCYNVVTTDGENTTVANCVGYQSTNASFVDDGGQAHSSRFNSFLNCKSVASAVGFYMSSKSTDASVIGCSSDGDTIPFSNTGIRTFWNDNTGGLPNFVRIVPLPLAGTTTPTVLTMADSKKVYYVQSGATEKAVVFLPESTNDNVGMQFIFKVKSALGIDVKPFGSQIIVINALSSLTGVRCTAAGGTVTLEADLLGRWQASSSLGTWTAI